MRKEAPQDVTKHEKRLSVQATSYRTEKCDSGIRGRIYGGTWEDRSQCLYTQTNKGELESRQPKTTA